MPSGDEDYSLGLGEGLSTLAFVTACSISSVCFSIYFLQSAISFSVCFLYSSVCLLQSAISFFTASCTLANDCVFWSGLSPFVTSLTLLSFLDFLSSLRRWSVFFAYISRLWGKRVGPYPMSSDSADGPELSKQGLPRRRRDNHTICLRDHSACPIFGKVNTASLGMSVWSSSSVSPLFLFFLAFNSILYVTRVFPP